MGQLKYRLCITDNCLILHFQGNHLLESTLQKKRYPKEEWKQCTLFLFVVLYSSLFLNPQKERTTDSWPTLTGTRT